MPVSKFRRWAERLVLLAGLSGIGIWAASRVSTIIYQSWQSFAFECRLQQKAPTLLDYAAEQGKRLIAAEERWCGLASEPSTIAAPAAAPRPHPPRPTPRDGLVGRLVIPRLHLGEIVREGDGAGTLSVALGHIPGTAFPGQEGNVGVAGHRDTLFRSLRSIEKNDNIQFQTLTGSYNYRVDSVEIVKPTDVAVLAPGSKPQLTLVTCYPFYYVGAAPDRFIVKAHLVSP